MKARTSLMYSSAFRHYLVGKGRQEYFDEIIKGLEVDLDHLLVMADPNWFFYLQVVNGKPVFRDNWRAFKEQLRQSQEKFETLMMNFMINVKTGMANLPTKINPIEPRKIIKTKLPGDDEEPLGQEEEIQLSENTVDLRTNGHKYSFEELLPNLIKADDETW